MKTLLIALFIIVSIQPGYSENMKYDAESVLQMTVEEGLGIIENLKDPLVLAEIAKKSKYKAICKAAIKKISDPVILSDVAKNGLKERKERDIVEEYRAKHKYISNSSVGETAVDKINDSAILADIAKNSNDCKIRFYAADRLSDQSLFVKIAKMEKCGYSAEAVAKIIKPEYIVDVAINASKSYVRQQAVKRVKNPTVLFKIAEADTNTTVREIAITNLDDQSFLVRIAKHNSTKYIRFLAMEKLPLLKKGSVYFYRWRYITYPVLALLILAISIPLVLVSIAGIMIQYQKIATALGRKKQQFDDENNVILQDSASLKQEEPGENEADIKGRQLFDACIYNQTEEILELIAAGADVNFQNEHGATPLFMLAQGGQPQNIRILLENGADVNISSHETKMSPLHWAAALGDDDRVRMFIDAGADIHLKNHEGYTPLDLARKNNVPFFSEIEKLIQAAENNKNQKSASPVWDINNQNMAQYFSNLTIEEKREMLNIHPGTIQSAIDARQMGPKGIEATVINPDEAGTNTVLIDGPTPLDKLCMDALKLIKDINQISIEANQLGETDPQTAIEKYKQVIAVCEWDEISLMSIGTCLAKMGRFDEGIQWLEKAYAANPQNERVKDNLAAVKKMTGA